MRQLLSDGGLGGPLLFAVWLDDTGSPLDVTCTLSPGPTPEGIFGNETFLTFTLLCEGFMSDGLSLGAADTVGAAL